VPGAYQRQIYDAICANQIQMKDPIFEAWDDTFLWNEAVQESNQAYLQQLEDQKQGVAPLLALCSNDPNLGFVDSALFGHLWRPAISSFALILQSYDDAVCQGLERYIEEEDEVLPPSTYGSSVSVGVKGISKVEGMLSQSVQGYLLCARTAQHYNLVGAADNMVISLCRFTTPSLSLGTEFQSGQLGAPRGELINNNRQSIIARFGRSARAMHACQAIFQISRKYGNAQRESWKNVVNLFTTIYMLELLPEQQEHVADEGSEFFFLSQNHRSPIFHRRPSKEKACASTSMSPSCEWVCALLCRCARARVRMCIRMATSCSTDTSCCWFF
jgi:hypothetical protein